MAMITRNEAKGLCSCGPGPISRILQEGKASDALYALTVRDYSGKLGKKRGDLYYGSEYERRY